MHRISGRNLLTSMVLTVISRLDLIFKLWLFGCSAVDVASLDEAC